MNIIMIFFWFLSGNLSNFPKCGDIGSSQSCHIWRYVSPLPLPPGRQQLQLLEAVETCFSGLPLFSMHKCLFVCVCVSNNSSSHVYIQFQINMSDISLSWIAVGVFHSTVFLTKDVQHHNINRRHSSALDSLSTSQEICQASVYTQIRIHEINSLDLNLLVGILVKDAKIWAVHRIIAHLIKMVCYFELRQHFKVHVLVNSIIIWFFWLSQF